MMNGTAVVKFQQHTITLDLADGKDFVAREFAADTFEKPLPAVFAATVSHIRGGFLDVGAHDGIYSLIAAKVRPDVRIECFEPFPLALGALRRNISINGVDERIVVRDFALSDQTGTGKLHIPRVNHGFTVVSSCSLQDDFQPWGEAIDIKTQRLDDVDLDTPPGLIKVDIEGHEHAFMAGAEETLRRHRPIMFVEVLSGARLDALDAFRQQLGYVDIRLYLTAAIGGGSVIFDDAAWNHAWVPPESLSRFLSDLHRCGLSVDVHGAPDRWLDRVRRRLSQFAS